MRSVVSKHSGENAPSFSPECNKVGAIEKDKTNEVHSAAAVQDPLVLDQASVQDHRPHLWRCELQVERYV